MSEKMKEWKKTGKTITGLILFGAVLVAVVVFLSYLYRPVTNSRENICGFYAETKDSLDMVYIGGSACYVYWEPLAAWKDYGFTSYNFATDAIPPQVIPYIMEEIRKTQSPEVFLVDLRPYQYGELVDSESGLLNYQREAPLRNVIDNMKYSGNRAAMIQACVPENQDRMAYHFDLAKYHSLLISLLEPENWKYSTNEYSMPDKGFHPCEEKEALPIVDVSGIREKAALEPHMDELLTELLEYCRKEELQVLFLVHTYEISEEDQKLYNTMEEKILSYGFDYLNTNDVYAEIGLDAEQDFYNRNHVNLLGADKYTSFLADYLKEHYELPDKRQDPAYQKWTEAYQDWQKRMEPIRSRLKGES